ncbi:MAG: hypothetical protein NVS4B1_09810 [Ktedonobacteraceae bacterium]
MVQPTEEKQPSNSSASTSGTGEKEPLFAASTSDFVLAEYNTLRTELLQRLSTRYQIMALTFTAFSAILAVQAFGGNNVMNTYLVLLYPILTFFLLNTYISNSRRINRIEDYIIHTENFVKCSLAVPAREHFGWLNYYEAKYGDEKKSFIKPFTFGGRFIFPASALVTTLAAASVAWPDFIALLLMHKGTLMAYFFAGDIVLFLVSIVLAIFSYPVFKIG